MNIRPRGVMPANPEQLSPLSPSQVPQIPKGITALIGSDPKISDPGQGRANLTMMLSQGERQYILKIARGDYRSRELENEHLAMSFLSEQNLPVPPSLIFIRQGELAFQLRDFVCGQPLSRLMKEEPETRPAYVAGLARTLAAIHSTPVHSSRTWHDWLEDMLATGELNMKNGALDTTEFHEQTPVEMLAWLKANKPAPGNICVVHGDWRPKNVLWQGGISAVIDWAFADLGDPWYDLAIGLWYLKHDERETFFRHYPLPPDPKREDYFERLARFTAV